MYGTAFKTSNILGPTKFRLNSDPNQWSISLFLGEWVTLGLFLDLIGPRGDPQSPLIYQSKKFSKIFRDCFCFFFSMTPFHEQDETPI